MALKLICGRFKGRGARPLSSVTELIIAMLGYNVRVNKYIYIFYP